jgi:serine/threonine protein kinase
MDAMSTSDDDCASPFNTKRRTARVDDVEVLCAVVYQVLLGLRNLQRLAHTAAGGERYAGFAHQDLRLDNVLVNRDGHVALCDFELVGHLPAGGGCVTRPPADGNVRLLPFPYHPPEGVNGRHGDVWLLGLMCLDLYTGVTPLVNGIAAFDDFGDGPLLTVDPDVGIDWPHFRVAVERHIRPWPAADAPGAGARHFADFVGRCLRNDPADRASVDDLLLHPAMAPFAAEHAADGFADPRAPVREWLGGFSATPLQSPS